MIYHEQQLPEDLVNRSLQHKGTLQEAEVREQGTKDARNSSIGWITNTSMLQEYFRYIQATNNLFWNYRLTDIEPMQYTEYGKGQYYNWHIDTHNKPYKNGLIRKLSFIVFLSGTFSGGEFNISEKDPRKKNRYITITNEKNKMIVFHSADWHRVRPVKTGTRNTIVGWVLGPKWK